MGYLCMCFIFTILENMHTENVGILKFLNFLSMVPILYMICCFSSIAEKIQVRSYAQQHTRIGMLFMTTKGLPSTFDTSEERLDSKMGGVAWTKSSV